MAKNIIINIKNNQLAEAVNLDKFKKKLGKKKDKDSDSKKEKEPKKSDEPKKEVAAKKKAPAAEPKAPVAEKAAPEEKKPAPAAKPEKKSEAPAKKVEEAKPAAPVAKKVPPPKAAPAAEKKVAKPRAKKRPEQPPLPPITIRGGYGTANDRLNPQPAATGQVKLGPTGKHIRDLLPTEKPKKKPSAESTDKGTTPAQQAQPKKGGAHAQQRGKHKIGDFTSSGSDSSQDSAKKKGKVREFRDIQPLRRQSKSRFGAKDRAAALRSGDGDNERWRKKRQGAHMKSEEEQAIDRPSEITVRLPIIVKDLAAQMKLKASQLISKMFMQGLTLTLNDVLDDATIIELLCNEFNMEVTIDTSEEERIQITQHSISEEVAELPEEKKSLRPPVVTFMGHVDHGKTSLLDNIRETRVAAGEAGSITQHIGAFSYETPIGKITFLDTPGHEAFSAMRARGSSVTDIVVLVIAGDDGIKPQTLEAIKHAQEAEATIIVAINKCDKPAFNADEVYRQLAEQNLLPEAWGGSTVTINCSAKTGEGIDTLLEMVALQAEVLELKSVADYRARGTVIESEMHKGLGAVATLLVQNGTLRKGDSLVFDQCWARVKTLRNDLGQHVKEAPPSTPVEITGLSSLPEAGHEFIVVSSDQEAKAIAETRLQQYKESMLTAKKPISMDSLFQEAGAAKKSFKLLLRADVQGSLEALKNSFAKIKSEKIDLDIIYSGIGEITESDVQLAAASNAVIFGFHTSVESHVETIIKDLNIQIYQHDIIYAAIDELKALMAASLDKVREEHDRSSTLVKATFKASHLGVIAGCEVQDGIVHRNHHARVLRDGEVIWTGAIDSLRREKEDVKEVKQGLECGILLKDFNGIQEDDIIQSFEVTYVAQDL